jgi:hypothetical protein
MGRLFSVVPHNANLEIRFRGSLLYLTRSQAPRSAIRVSLDWSTTLIVVHLPILRGFGLVRTTGLSLARALFVTVRS